MGSLQLPHRIIMSPLTRCRASEGRVPNALMAEYYRQRASAGLILLYDFKFGSTISTWFNKPGWEWKLPVAFVIGVAINLVVTVERLRSGRLREAAMKDLEHSHALLLNSQKLEPAASASREA